MSEKGALPTRLWFVLGLGIDSIKGKGNMRGFDIYIRRERCMHKSSELREAKGVASRLLPRNWLLYSGWVGSNF